ncbi:MAG TPA: EAL domain-containing protein [Phycisphaerales bacterium]|nr:EAL domain-containing protein [Phycisphaerales bacterium]
MPLRSKKPSSSGHEGTVFAPGKHTTPLPNRRVLVVDGDAAAIESYRSALCAPPGPRPQSGECFTVDTCRTRAEALQHLRRAAANGERYSVAFVDMREPPAWEGVEIVENLWREDAEIEIVLCSAFSGHTWGEITARLGHTDRLLLLRKPFDHAEAWQMANALSQKWDLHRHVETQVTSLAASNESLRAEVARRKLAESSAVHASLHDALTGLPNRPMLTDRLDRALRRAQRDPSFKFAVLFLDLDNFKLVNDSLGHDAGDTLLREFAARLATSLRRVDTLSKSDASAGRLGGDEFVVVLEGIRQRSDAVLVAERISEVLTQPFHLSGQDVRVTASIGISFSDTTTGPSATADSILQQADTAMYRAKGSGKARHALFDHTMHEQVIERLRLENDLRFALERGELRLAYQPIIHLSDGVIKGFEALLRWRHPVLGDIPPERFIPIAEELGLINEIGSWVISTACRDVGAWNRTSGIEPPVCVNVNLSKRQLWSSRIVDEIQAIISGASIEPSWLSVEVTESMIMAEPQSVRERLLRLRDMGVSTQIDDFGTGHSSLSCLHHFPIDILKVDKAFVGTTVFKRDYAAVIAAIATLAHNLGAKVTAEGVETEAQLAMLLAVDCDYGQGFLFSRPVEADKVLEMITNRRTWRQAA